MTRAAGQIAADLSHSGSASAALGHLSCDFTPGWTAESAYHQQHQTIGKH